MKKLPYMYLRTDVLKGREMEVNGISCRLPLVGLGVWWLTPH